MPRIQPATLALVAFVLLLSSAPGQFTQTLPRNLEASEGGSIAAPFNVASATHQWAYDSSLFDYQGPMTITGISIRANANAPVAAFILGGFEVVLSSAAVAHTALSTTNLASNLFNDQQVVRPASTFSGGPVNSAPGGLPAPFFTLGLTNTFSFNPALGRDLILQIRWCSAPTPMNASLDEAPSALAAAITSNSCTPGPSGTLESGAGLVLLVQFTAPPQFETNSIRSDLRINGVDNTPFTKLRLDRCTLQSTMLTIRSSLVGLGWQMGSASAPALSRDQGAPVSPSTGQIINVNLNAPDFEWLFGQTLPPFPGNLEIPFTRSTPGEVVSSQLGVVDPTMSDGFSLSACCEARYLAPIPLANTVAGPTGDDTSVVLSVGCIPFSGSAYTQVSVSSNGRLNFGTTSNANNPTIAGALANPPFVGAWCDLNPSLGGTISALSPTPTSFRIDYLNVRYDGSTASSPRATFAIEIDTDLGTILIDGLATIGNPGITRPMFLGLSRGAGATNPGPRNFQNGGPELASSGTDMLYVFGQAGTLGTGLNALIFTPETNSLLFSGGYSWISF